MIWNCESLWTSIFNNMMEMGEFFEIHGFIKLAQNTRCLDWPLSLKDIESVITNFTQTEC